MVIWLIDPQLQILLTFTNYLHDSFYNSAQTNVVYLDFSKAIDVIDHSLLMNELWDSGIHGNVYYLIESYLSNRYQIVRHLKIVQS